MSQLCSTCVWCAPAVCSAKTAQSVKEIAQQTGFDDEHYFCRFFKLKTGLTPGQWRLRSRPKPRDGEKEFRPQMNADKKGGGEARYFVRAGVDCNRTARM